jgi:hypothetical protein
MPTKTKIDELSEIYYCSSQDSSQDSSQGHDQENAKILGISITQCFYFTRYVTRASYKCSTTSKQTLD